MSQHALVLQSDFGLDDGAVNAMYGVAYSVDSSLRIFDLTHNIPVFHIWEASYRLLQSVSYWPEGTVFVSVVDPGVGSERRSVAVRTSSDQYIITPDNGTLTHISRQNGIVEVRYLDEAQNRLRDQANHILSMDATFTLTPGQDWQPGFSASTGSVRKFQQIPSSNFRSWKVISKMIG